MTRDWTFAGCAGGSTRRAADIDRPLDGSQLDDGDGDEDEDDDDDDNDWITA